MNRESFAELFQESLAQSDLRPGAVVKATVVKILSDYVIVNAGLKSEARIPIEEFMNEQRQLDVKEGDELDVVVEIVEDGFGETRLSREKARRSEAWITLEKAYKANQTVRGIITERVKGGFTVDLQSVRAFLPGSLVDVKPVRDSSYLEGKELDFKVIKMDRKRNNVVVSRRAVVQEEAERSAVLEGLQEGQIVTGVVKNITDYGAFVDLGGVDGLLHITDMSWKRIKHPSEVLKVGEEIRVKVLKYDRDKKRVSLGLKQLGDDPWSDLARRYPVGKRLLGHVTNLTDYGCFVEIETGIEGLVHMSEMDWTNKNVHPAKVVQVGQEVEVMVLDIDEERRRISLGIKQCMQNPWKEFEDAHQKGEKIRGKIRSITDFGIFVGLEGNIDGLIHLSDLSWNEIGEQAVRHYKKGDDVEAVILGIDAERERISLGIKQLEGDPFSQFVEFNPKGSIVKGHISRIAAKEAVVDLGGGIEGQLRAADIGNNVTDINDHFKVDDEIEAKIINIDRKNRIIYLSLKELASPQDRDRETSGTTLGDLLKEQMESKE
jgi:small subunit ribosomal protein S1